MKDLSGRTVWLDWADKYELARLWDRRVTDSNPQAFVIYRFQPCQGYNLLRSAIYRNTPRPPILLTQARSGPAIRCPGA